MTKKRTNYYLLPEEEGPHRTCQSKNFVPKVMFLVVIARPRFDAEGNVTFDGKIGVFPFITKETAKRTSVNRAAGTLVTKPIISVTREISRKFLIEKVVPAIKEKWPRDEIGYPIFIQQDNARCHVSVKDAEFCAVATADGFDIRLMCQPPNSPDLNILDIGFFSSIQSIQEKITTKTIDELVQAVETAFEIFEVDTSNRIFLTLQTCMVEIMKRKGSNQYDIPHIKKTVLQRQGQLPTQIKCDLSLVEEVRHYLSMLPN
ncbi:transposase [Trifolium medium]|uniref:Transposase n=1 Tax=Trifolium medium TaxID=97028 RepID=A0A392MRR2_9FABA|nr:transposase [Trifolium medium]